MTVITRNEGRADASPLLETNVPQPETKSPAESMVDTEKDKRIQKQRVEAKTEPHDTMTRTSTGEVGLGKIKAETLELPTDGSNPFASLPMLLELAARIPRMPSKHPMPDLTLPLMELVQRPDAQAFSSTLAGRIIFTDNAIQSGDVLVDSSTRQIVQDAARLITRDFNRDGARGQDSLNERQQARLQEVIKQTTAMFSDKAPTQAAFQQVATAKMQALRSSMTSEGAHKATGESGIASFAAPESEPAGEQAIVLPSPELNKLERAMADFTASLDGMDITEAAQIVMLECAKGHEQDVKDMIVAMQKNNKQRAIMRDQINRSKAEQAHMDKVVSDEYFRRTQLDPKNTLWVDSSRFSLEDYKKTREIAMNAADVANDPENATALMQLTNNLVIFPRTGEDMGPTPTADRLDEIAEGRQGGAVHQWETDTGTYNKHIEEYCAAWGTKKEETIAYLQLAVHYNISNDSIGSLLEFYNYAKAEGIYGLAASFEEFLSAPNKVAYQGEGNEDGQTFTNSVNIGLTPGMKPEQLADNIASATAVAKNQINTRIQYANTIITSRDNEITASYSVICSLQALAALGGYPGMDGARLNDLIVAEQNKIREITKDWSNAQKAHANSLRKTAEANFEAGWKTAVEADINRAKELVGTDPNQVDAVANTNARDGSWGIYGWVDKAKRPYVNPDAPHDVYDCNVEVMKVRFGWDSNVVALLKPALTAGGVDINDPTTKTSFDNYQATGWMQQLRLTVGTKPWHQGDPGWNWVDGGRQKLFEQCAEPGNAGTPGTFLCDDDRSMSFRTSQQDLWGLFADIQTPAAANEGLSDNPDDYQQAYVDAFAVSTGARAAGEEDGLPPPDPRITGVTLDSAIDAALQQVRNGPPTPETINTVLEALWTRYPGNRASFEAYASWMVGLMINPHPGVGTAFPEANAKALLGPLTEGFERKQREQQEVIDKHNKEEFMSNPEPSKSLKRETLGVWTAMIEGLQNKFDTLGDLGQEMQTRLQLLMDRRAKMYETLSAIIKKSGQTGDAIIANMK